MKPRARCVFFLPGHLRPPEFPSMWRRLPTRLFVLCRQWSLKQEKSRNPCEAATGLICPSDMHVSGHHPRVHTSTRRTLPHCNQNKVAYFLWDLCLKWMLGERSQQSWPWRRMSIVPAFGGWAGRLSTSSKPKTGWHNSFQASQGYSVSLCLNKIK